jgi:hypothetical protein
MKRYRSVREKWVTKYEDDGNGNKKPVRVNDEEESDEEKEEEGCDKKK